MSDQPPEDRGLHRIDNVFSRAVSAAGLAMAVNAVTESPIETLFGVALLRQLSVFSNYVWWGHATRKSQVVAKPIEVIAQYWWRNYRIDWAIIIRGEPAIFIECDGQEFHSSEEQQEKDRIRDESIIAAGIEIFRFTGSDLHNNDTACGQLVARAVAGRLLAR